MKVTIIGGGKVGNRLAAKLLESNHRVKLVEQRPAVFTRLAKAFPPEALVLGSGSDPLVLEAAGIRQSDVLAAVTGDDEVNLVVATLARFEFQVPRVIARVNNAKNAWLFTGQMGVDVALNQADLMATLISEEMSLGEMITLLKVHRGRYALVEERVHAQARAAGKALRELPLPAPCVLTTVIRNGELLLPRGDLVLQPNDEILALVESAYAPELAALLSAGSGTPTPAA